MFPRLILSVVVVRVTIAVVVVWNIEDKLRFLQPSASIGDGTGVSPLRGVHCYDSRRLFTIKREARTYATFAQTISTSCDAVVGVTLQQELLEMFDHEHFPNPNAEQPNGSESKCTVEVPLFVRSLHSYSWINIDPYFDFSFQLCVQSWNEKSVWRIDLSYVNFVSEGNSDWFSSNAEVEELCGNWMEEKNRDSLERSQTIRWMNFIRGFCPQERWPQVWNICEHWKSGRNRSSYLNHFFFSKLPLSYFQKGLLQRKAHYTERRWFLGVQRLTAQDQEWLRSGPTTFF